MPRWSRREEYTCLVCWDNKNILFDENSLAFGTGSPIATNPRLFQDPRTMNIIIWCFWIISKRNHSTDKGVNNSSKEHVISLKFFME
uniref:Uncharacterized protein n=1 Tax=Romanomermis culicivorax TaxID=13658 RepID=A0A915KZR9_ROMCU